MMICMMCVYTKSPVYFKYTVRVYTSVYMSVYECI